MDKPIPSCKLNEASSRKGLQANASRALPYQGPENGPGKRSLRKSRHSTTPMFPGRIYQEKGGPLSPDRHGPCPQTPPLRQLLQASKNHHRTGLLSTGVDMSRHPLDIQKPFIFPPSGNRLTPSPDRPPIDRGRQGSTSYFIFLNAIACSARGRLKNASCPGP